MANNNSGADALIGRILADAQAEADTALADADKEAERIALIAKDECFRTENETELRTKRLNDAAQEKSRTNAALDSRKCALKVKRALIDEAFALAAERMEQKSDAERSALIKALLIREAEGGETIIPAARDEANVKNVLAEVNAALAGTGRLHRIWQLRRYDQLGRPFEMLKTLEMSLFAEDFKPSALTSMECVRVR